LLCLALEVRLSEIDALVLRGVLRAYPVDADTRYG